jgi:ankyrin repeat protein
MLGIKHYECELTLKKFLDAGADINSKDSEGLSLLHHAIKINSEVLVRFLLSMKNHLL